MNTDRTMEKKLAGEAIRYLVWDSIDSRLSFIGLIQPMSVLLARKGCNADFE